MGHGHSHDSGAGHGHSHGGGHGHSHGAGGACDAPASPSPSAGGAALAADLGDGRTAFLWAALGGPGGSVLHIGLAGCAAREADVEADVSDWAGTRVLQFVPAPRDARPPGEGAGACTRFTAKAARMSAAAGPLKITAPLVVDGAAVVATFVDFFPARHAVAP